MSDYQQDPSANTGRFRAFVEEAEPERARRGTKGWLIWGAVFTVAIIVVIVVAVH